MSVLGINAEIKGQTQGVQRWAWEKKKKMPTGRAEVEQKGKDGESKEERWKEREGGYDMAAVDDLYHHRRLLGTMDIKTLNKSPPGAARSC